MKADIAPCLPWRCPCPPHDTRWRSQITPRAVALFKRALEIEACDDDDFREEDGGRKREYLDITDQLHQALGLKPYEPSPLDCDGEPPSWEGHPELWHSD